MNIFNVLSQGKSRLHEPSLSAMLGYLLSPHEDHGLGDTFLRGFLAIAQNLMNEGGTFVEILKRNFISANVELEVQYSHQGKRKDIDIQLSILDKTNSKEIHRIIIENKIKVGAANPKQLSDYYDAVRNDEDFILEEPDLTIIFLTPNSSSNTLQSEFENVQQMISNEHRCIWLKWSKNEEQESVLGLIKAILKQELISEINPINEYMKHTLKAFVRHVSSVTSVYKGRTNMRTGEDIGDIVEEVDIQTKDGKRHRIIRRDSTQIQVFNVETGEKEVARHVMADYIDEEGMDIPHARLNTRMIGKKLLDKLR